MKILIILRGVKQDCVGPTFLTFFLCLIVRAKVNRYELPQGNAKSFRSIDLQHKIIKKKHTQSDLEIYINTQWPMQ